MIKAAVAALTVLLQQIDNASHCLLGIAAPFQRQTQQIHTSKAGFTVSALGKHGLVADAQAVLIDTDLGAPHPDRAGEEHGVRFADLRNGDIGAGHLTAQTGPGGVEFRHLYFVGTAVTVFGKHCANREQSAQSIAHRELSFLRFDGCQRMKLVRRGASRTGRSTPASLPARMQRST